AAARGLDFGQFRHAITMRASPRPRKHRGRDAVCAGQLVARDVAALDSPCPGEERTMKCRNGWLVAALLLACAPVFAGEKEPAKGTLPPPLLGKDRDGQVIDLATMHGKVVIVTFWASWCGYCLKELPVLNALQE